MFPLIPMTLVPLNFDTNIYMIATTLIAFGIWNLFGSLDEEE